MRAGRGQHMQAGRPRVTHVTHAGRHNQLLTNEVSSTLCNTAQQQAVGHGKAECV